MLPKLRPHLSYANVVSTACLSLLLGGTAVAAITITGKNVQNGSLTGKDVKNSSLTGTDVKNKSLTPSDFNGSVTGPQGPKGDTGPQGPKGDPGSGSIDGIAAGGDLTGTYPNPLVGANAIGGAEVVESSLGKVPDADKLDGVDSSQYQRVGLVTTGAADETDPDGFAFVLPPWDQLANITTDGDADADHTLRILNTGSQNLTARSAGAQFGLIPGQAGTVSVGGEVASFLIWSADGTRSWLIVCAEDLGNNQIRCQGVANRLG
jgi:hypothetical protein